MTFAKLRAGNITSHTMLVAGASALTLLLTMLWQWLIARTFGASPAMDAFWVAAGIPRTIAESFHFGLLTLLFVLVFQRQDGDEGDPWRRASAVLNLTLVVTAVCILVLVAAAPLIVSLTAPGLGAAEQAAATTMMRRLAWMLGPTAVAAALGGVAMAGGNFLPLMLSRAAMPALQVMTLLLFGASLATNALVLALWIGAVGGLLLFLPWARRAKVRYYPGFDWHDPSTRRVMRLQATLAVMWLLIVLNQIVDRYLASTIGAGSVSALEFAWRFEIPISQIVGVGVALPTFALLARSVASKRHDEFRQTLGASARLLFMTVVPMLGFLVVLREPIALVWFEGGRFSADSARLVASLIPALSAVYFCRAFAPIVVFGLLTVGRAPVLLAGLTCELVLHAGLGLVLSRTLGLPGVVLGSAIAMAVVNSALWVTLLREVGGFSGRALLARALPVAAVGAVAIMALELSRRAVEGVLPLGAGGLQALLPLAVVGAGYLACYVAGYAFTGMLGGRLTS